MFSFLSRWRRTLARLGRLAIAVLSKPGWQGWGTILTGISILATVAVAVILYRFTQEEEERRREETRANFFADVQLWRVEDTPGRWVMELTLANHGLASADPIKATVRVGGAGVRPVGAPFVSRGDLQLPLLPVSSAGVCYTNLYVVRVQETILKGDHIDISQDFYVEPWRDGELQEDPSLRPGMGRFRSGAAPDAPLAREGVLSTWWIIGEAKPAIIDPFMSLLRVSGNNVDFEDVGEPVFEKFAEKEGCYDGS